MKYLSRGILQKGITIAKKQGERMTHIRKVDAKLRVVAIHGGDSSFISTHVGIKSYLRKIGEEVCLSRWKEE
jgi:hypothetical protein